MSDYARKVRRTLWTVMALMAALAAASIGRDEWIGAAGFVFALLMAGASARLVRSVDETRNALHRAMADRDAILRARPTPGDAA